MPWREYSFAARVWNIVIIGSFLLISGAGCDDPKPPAPPPSEPAPTTAPATQPTTTPAEEISLVTYLDFVKHEQPEFAASELHEPLPYALALEEAARLTFDAPVYLDAAGNLWITHELGQSPADLPNAGEDLRRQTFIVNQRITFAWWKNGPGGVPTVELIVETDDGEYVWHHLTGQASIPSSTAGAYDFSRAFAHEAGLVVPTVGGVALLQLTGLPDDPAQWLRRYANLPEDERPGGNGLVEIDAISLINSGNAPPTELRLHGYNLLAWVPANDSTDGGIARRPTDGKWAIADPADGWTTRPVHLIPLADGAVLQMGLDAEQNVVLSLQSAHAQPIDRASIELLVKDLINYDKNTRDNAFVQLSTLGPAARSILEEFADTDNQRIEGELNLILGYADGITIGGVLPEPGPVIVRERFGDGGALFEFPNGMSVPSAAGINVLQKPGLLVVRPGRRVEALPDMLATELEADPQTRLYTWGDEWIVSRPGEPPRRWGVNHFEPLLGEGKADWQSFAGVDAVGRWLFHERTESSAPIPPTLLLDVRLPDPRPQLPTWVIETGELGEAGWDEQDYPTMKLGGAWRLLETGWESLPPETDIETRDTVSGQWELAIDADGNSYYDGLESLRVLRPDGTEFSWPLPPEAIGTGQRTHVKLAVDNKGRLFLFNRPGRVIRIEPTTPTTPTTASTTGETEPYKIIGIFDEDIPGAVPRRAWVDPLGRICASYFGDTVVVMWPDGQVPAPIRQLMPAKRRDMSSPFEGA